MTRMCGSVFVVVAALALAGGACGPAPADGDAGVDPGFVDDGGDDARADAGGDDGGEGDAGVWDGGEQGSDGGDGGAASDDGGAPDAGFFDAGPHPSFIDFTVTLQPYVITFSPHQENGSDVCSTLREPEVGECVTSGDCPGCECPFAGYFPEAPCIYMVAARNLTTGEDLPIDFLFGPRIPLWPQRFAPSRMNPRTDDLLFEMNTCIGNAAYVVAHREVSTPRILEGEDVVDAGLRIRTDAPSEWRVENGYGFSGMVCHTPALDAYTVVDDPYSFAAYIAAVAPDEALQSDIGTLSVVRAAQMFSGLSFAASTAPLVWRAPAGFVEVNVRGDLQGGRQLAIDEVVVEEDGGLLRARSIAASPSAGIDAIELVQGLDTDTYAIVVAGERYAATTPHEPIAPSFIDRAEGTIVRRLLAATPFVGEDQSTLLIDVDFMLSIQHALLRPQVAVVTDGGVDDAGTDGGA